MKKIGHLKAQILLGLLLIGSLVFPSYAAELQLKSEIQEALKSQIEKIKKLGNKDFFLLYIKETNDSARVVYSVINTKFDPKLMGTDKWLEGLTVRKQLSGHWIYVGRRSTTYESEEKLEQMKAWANEVMDWAK